MVDSERVKLLPQSQQAGREEFLYGTTLCGCDAHRSPVDGQSHCCSRFMCALCCTGCFAGATVSEAFEEKPICCSMGTFGLLTCVALELLERSCCAGNILGSLVEGKAITGSKAIYWMTKIANVTSVANCASPIAMTPVITYRLGTPGPQGCGGWTAFVCSAVCCFPCHLVRVRNHTELAVFEKRNQNIQPAPQVKMF